MQGGSDVSGPLMLSVKPVRKAGAPLSKQSVLAGRASGHARNTAREKGR